MDIVPQSSPSNRPSCSTEASPHHALGLLIPDKEALREYFNLHLRCDSRVHAVASSMSRERWLVANDPEPPLYEDDVAVREGLLPIGKSHSRFDLFFEKKAKHGCLWLEGDQRCAHETTRKHLAREHAYLHFNYKPLKCDGKCGVNGW